ncbi:hypothetical protein N7445_007197 [Penicillium cf. griseofulvum]|nr:hypothetical protein N7445_007197 [Penicillium cf. griseofulvum]
MSIDDWGADYDNIKYFVDKTPKECIQTCTNTAECERAIWLTSAASNTKGQCWLRPYTLRSRKVPVKHVPNYSSAHRQ